MVALLPIEIGTSFLRTHPGSPNITSALEKLSVRHKPAFGFSYPYAIPSGLRVLYSILRLLAVDDPFPLAKISSTGITNGLYVLDMADTSMPGCLIIRAFRPDAPLWVDID